jgi:hypothetical protein
LSNMGKLMWRRCILALFRCPASVLVVGPLKSFVKSEGRRYNTLKIANNIPRSTVKDVTYRTPFEIND